MIDRQSVHMHTHTHTHTPVVRAQQGAWVLSLVRELRSHKPSGVAIYICVCIYIYTHILSHSVVFHSLRPHGL